MEYLATIVDHSRMQNKSLPGISESPETVIYLPGLSQSPETGIFNVLFDFVG